MEMGGFSITLLKLDEELIPYLDAPCYSPYYAKGAFILPGKEAWQKEQESAEEKPEKDGSFLSKNRLEKEKGTRIEEARRTKKGVLSVLDAADCKEMLSYVADRVIREKNFLTKVDSAIGDGDHGTGMAGGMLKVKERMSEIGEAENVFLPFEMAGEAMLHSMGGASGVIFGSLYLEGSRGKASKALLCADDFLQMQKESLAAIQNRGGAKPGDKTMVDALYHAIEEMEKVRDDGLLPLLQAAERGAREGLEKTKGYIAKYGRAKSLGERAIGHQDAGATSVWMIFRAMREYVGDAFPEGETDAG